MTKRTVHNFYRCSHVLDVSCLRILIREKSLYFFLRKSKLPQLVIDNHMASCNSIDSTVKNLCLLLAILWLVVVFIIFDQKSIALAAIQTLVHAAHWLLFSFLANFLRLLDHASPFLLLLRFERAKHHSPRPIEGRSLLLIELIKVGETYATLIRVCNDKVLRHVPGDIRTWATLLCLILWVLKTDHSIRKRRILTPRVPNLNK